MRPIVTDWVAWTVGLSVSLYPAKTAEPIEMLLGLRTLVGSARTTMYYMGDQIRHESGNFVGKGASLCCKVYRDTLRSSVQKTAEPIEMPFGL